MTFGIARTYAGGQWENNLTATPDSANVGLGLTSGGSPHTKGTYGTLLAAAAYDLHGFWIGVSGTGASTTLTHMLLDIALGATQDNIIVPDWMIGWRPLNSVTGQHMQYFPIFVPRGTQVSARISALIASDSARVLIWGCSGNSGLPGPLFSGCDAYGPDRATSDGVAHTPGDSGAESTAANVGGVTSKHYGAVMLGLHGSNTVTNTIGYHWELMIDSVPRAEWMSQMVNSESVLGPYPNCPIPVSIPVGTQLQIRGEASGVAQAHGVGFHCFY